MKKKIEMIHELQREVEDLQSTIKTMAEDNVQLVKNISTVTKDKEDMLSRIRRLESAFSRMGVSLPDLNS